MITAGSVLKFSYKITFRNASDHSSSPKAIERATMELIGALEITTTMEIFLYNLKSNHFYIAMTIITPA